MATGGTGDLLTGMIAAWLAQLLDAEAACRLAVFLHGAAGDLTENSVGQVAMTATDLMAHLGKALNRLVGKEADAGSGEHHSSHHFRRRNPCGCTRARGTAHAR